MILNSSLINLKKDYIITKTDKAITLDWSEKTSQDQVLFDEGDKANQLFNDNSFWPLIWKSK